MNQEVSLEALSDKPGGGWEAIDGAPSPEQTAITADLVAYLIRKCRDRNRPILKLYFEDYTVREISEKLNCCERTVKRALDRAWDVVARLFQEETKRHGEET